MLNNPMYYPEKFQVDCSQKFWENKKNVNRVKSCKTRNPTIGEMKMQIGLIKKINMNIVPNTNDISLANRVPILNVVSYLLLSW